MSSDTIGEKTRCRTLDQKEKDILNRSPPLPKHWRSPPPNGPLGVLQWTIFTVLCTASYGHAGLEPVWASIRLDEEGDDSVWVEGTRQICKRLNNMLVVGSLLLATSAAFITTVPPNPAMVNYALHGSYRCMVTAFGLLIGGIIITAVSFLVISKARPKWSENVLYRSRFHVYSTLIILSYPVFSIGTGSVLVASGLLSAILCAEDRALKDSAPVVASLPLSVGVLFGILYLTAKHKEGHIV